MNRGAFLLKSIVQCSNSWHKFLTYSNKSTMSLLKFKKPISCYSFCLKVITHWAIFLFYIDLSFKMWCASVIFAWAKIPSWSLQMTANSDFKYEFFNTRRREVKGKGISIFKLYMFITNELRQLENQNVLQPMVQRIFKESLDTNIPVSIPGRSTLKFSNCGNPFVINVCSN